MFLVRSHFFKSLRVFLSGIEDLELDRVPYGFITGDALAALAENTTIKSMDIFHIDDDAAAAIARMESLTSLRANYNLITAAGALALSRSATIQNLTLAANEIGDRGAVAFAGNTVLKRLDVSGNGVGVAGAGGRGGKGGREGGGPGKGMV